MANNNVQAALDRILEELTSGNVEREIAAIHELETINFSSEAIVLQLEKLVLRKSAVVRHAALRALRFQTSQFVSSKRSPLNPSSRAIILREIETWQENGLLEEHRADVLKRRYDFDIEPGIPVKKVETEPEEKPVQAAVPALKPAPVAAPQPKPLPAKPAEPRPSLTQILLSENSIRVYLYLGAFFVIASAAILAAVIEAARLPILLVATLIFAGGAIGLKKRLPQPSFALAVVFSFLLPIDANVISDSLNLSFHGNHFYWAGVLLFMTIVWGLGTWFYESRAFSLTAFIALMLGVWRFTSAVEFNTSWTVFMLAAANLIGLAFIRMIRSWKDMTFAKPLFYAAQAVQPIILLVTVAAIFGNMTESPTPTGAWIANMLTWVLAASFYAASNLIIPFLLFPWIAVASLFLVPNLFLAAFDVTDTLHIFGLALWGVITAIISEFSYRAKLKEVNIYGTPFLTLSIPLFGVAFLWGILDSTQHGFIVLLGAGLAYTIVNFMRARWYVWSGALLSLLGAYFLLFTLHFMHKLDVYFGYQVLIASLVLLVPELFMTEPLTLKRTWNWPPVALGAMLVALNILFAHVVLLDSASHFGHSAITLGIYSLLFAAFATHFKKPLLGYLSTTSLALTVIYSLIHFDLDLWLPSLTALSVIYYFAGYFLSRKEQTKDWGEMLITSGLALGMIFSTIAVFTLKATGGWYALVVGALFIIEMFTRRNGYLEIFAMTLFTIALAIILNDFKVQVFAYYLFGFSLIWLSGDVILYRTFNTRKTEVITRLIGGLGTIAFTMEVTSNAGLASASASTCFAVYTLFFAAYAVVYRKSYLGYFSTASAAVTMFYALDHFKIEAWLPIFTGLSLVYYFVGYFIHKKNADWSEMFRYSGLALGSIVSLVALMGIEKTGGWYALIVGVLFVIETVSRQNGWFEAGIHVLFSIAAFLILNDFKVYNTSYILLALSLVWLGGDVTLYKTFQKRQIATPVRVIGSGIAAINGILLLSGLSIEAAICFGVYAVFFAAYSLLYNEPMIGYVSTVSLPLAVFFGLQANGNNAWLFPIIAVSMIYYIVGFGLRRANKSKFDEMLLFSGLGLGTLIALLAPFQPGGIEKAIPIAIAATLFAVEAFALRNVWLAFPANGLYLISYFTILIELNVDQPQYFSIGAALLGMLMHYLLTHAESKTGALLMGTVSQLILLGTSYVQLVSTSEVGYFFVLFFQSLVIIFYGLYMRSRSLVFAPIGIVVLATLTILYSALQNLSLVIIIGVSGLVLLTLGILAVLMRERITSFVEKFNDWNA